MTWRARHRDEEDEEGKGKVGIRDRRAPPTVGEAQPNAIIDAMEGTSDGVNNNVIGDEAALQAEIEALVVRAHEAVDCGGYCLFDIRVDDRDPKRPRPYIIECCAF
mmetsp:Transcript_18154/g.43654  ORF Transcript_18154/g.43654 Transcript_18154/m.43654 type:complete len:106 (-) Transcript_18154:1338-1655(-)